MSTPVFPGVDQDTSNSNGHEPAPSSWRPRDLTAVLDGTWKPPEPTVGLRDDGKGLFYPSKCHTVVSETEGGKTWLALCVSVDEMHAGNHVLYLDFEDDEGGVVGRLLTLGASRALIAAQFHYIRPESPLDKSGADIIRDIATTYRPTFDVIDGITEAMVMHGLEPKDNTDAALFGRKLPRPLASFGAAVASLDHVTKDREGRGRYALGAVHKLNGLDGASYILENRHPFGIGITGRSTVKIAKDRIGQLRRNGLPSSGGMHWFGDLVLKSQGEDFAEVSIEPPHERDENFRPTILMERIAKALTVHGPFPSKNALEKAVPGRAQTIRDALAYLILDGYVSDSTPYALLRPYTP